MKRLSLLLVLLLASVGWGQISVQPSYQPYQPIIVGIDSAIPSDAEVKIRWSLTPPPKATGTLKVVGEGGHDAHIWASPGKHKLTASVTWIQFEEIEVTLADGTSKIIKNLLKWDSNFYEDHFTVEGGKPDPDPEPGPDPPPDPDPEPGPRWILMIHEVQDTNPARQALWSNIREIEDTRGTNDLIQIDDDAKRPDGTPPSWLAPYLELIRRRNIALPSIIIATKTTPAKVLYVGSAPSDIGAYNDLIKKYGGGDRSTTRAAISIPQETETKPISMIEQFERPKRDKRFRVLVPINF